MKKLKYFIIVLIVLLILISVVLIYIMNNKINTYEDLSSNDGEQKNEVNQNIDNITPEEMANEIEKSIKKQIKYKDVNSFITTTIDDERMAKKYYSDFTNKILYSPKLAYEQLDKEYREKRFGSYENFLSYINDIVGIIGGETFSKYKIEKNEDYTLYTVAGSDTRRYYFKETSVMQYIVYLDDYTIITDDMIKQYNNKSEEDKVQYNLAKFISMIEQKDYLQAYRLLDDKFKKNKFNTINKFKDYMKNQYYIDNYLNSLEKVGEENGFLKYQIILSDNSSENITNDEKIQRNFYIKLEENMNFKIKFDI